MKGIVGPIILIVTGALLLLTNLGLIHLGQVKALLLQWWPALLILAGLLQLRRR